MIIDAFEIYGHDPTDKLDNLWLYQNEMMRIKTAEDQVGKRNYNYMAYFF